MSPRGMLLPHGWSGRARLVSTRRLQPFVPERVPRAPARCTRGARGSQKRQDPVERRTCRARTGRGPRQRPSRRGPPGGSRLAKLGSSGHPTSLSLSPRMPRRGAILGRRIGVTGKGGADGGGRARGDISDVAAVDHAWANEAISTGGVECECLSYNVSSIIGFLPRLRLDHAYDSRSFDDVAVDDSSSGERSEW